jgi:hypothetical protein
LPMPGEFPIAWGDEQFRKSLVRRGSATIELAMPIILSVSSKFLATYKGKAAVWARAACNLDHE